ncbi:MAG: general secretion pathway protein GspB, partial [Candidatus Omnitrophota bacterium]
PSQESAPENKFVYDSLGKRNPFIALVTPDGRLLKIVDEEQSGGLTLEGIIYDEQGISFAMVNGSVVKIGDTINGYQVLKIESNRVIFIKDGEPFMAELKKEE